MSNRWLVVLTAVLLAVLTAYGQEATTQQPTIPTIVIDQELYSGQVDPQINFTTTSEIATLEGYLTGLTPTAKPNWPVSGERGFLLENYGVTSFPSSEVRVYCGVIREFVAVNQYKYFNDVNGLEAYLKSLFPSSQYTCTSNEKQISESQIQDSGQVGPLPPLLPTNGYEPPFNAGLWNTGDANQFQNNCYNYAGNKKTGTFAQPGRAGGRLRKVPFTCSDVIASAIADGLIPWVANVPCSNYDYKVALVVNPNPAVPPGDFHWLRQNRDGFWSQKHGGDPAINVDDDPINPMPIRDPRTANRDGYTNFCAFMCVRASPNNVNIN